MSDLSGETFFLDDFAFRQFDSGQIQTPKPDFVRQVHELYLQVALLACYRTHGACESLTRPDV